MAVLKQAYLMYRLFSGTYERTIETENVEVLKNKLDHFFSAVSASVMQLATCINHCLVLVFKSSQTSKL